MFSASSSSLSRRRGHDSVHRKTVLPGHRLVAALVAVLMLVGTITLSSPPPPAQASSLGVGESVTIPDSGGAELWFGNHINTWDSARVYCAEFNIYPTSGWNQTWEGLWGSGFVTRSSGTGADESIYTKTLSTADMTALNYILTTWGNTSNANQAASVGYAVWAITTNADVWSYQVSRSWFATGTAAFSGNGDYMVSLGRAYAASAAGAGTGSAAMSFQIEHSNNYLGDLTLDTLSPSPASGVITLTNGIFVSTGTSSISSSAFTQGQSIAVRGVPPVEGQTYKIRATASFDGGIGANVGAYTTGSRQLLITAGGRKTMNAVKDDPFDRSVGFQPILTSQVAERYLSSGDPLIDTVVFSLQADADGLVNEWAVSPVDGAYARVVAKGTVYGPFSNPPVQAATVPVGAPVAGTATVTTTNADGPTITYTATADNRATSAGYYVWVWKIDYADQPAATKIYLPGPAICRGVCGSDGYVWADDFGIAAETAIVVPTVSTMATPTGIAGYPITDTATVTGTVFDGAQLEFKAFLQVGATPRCTAATLAFTSPRQPVAGAGEYVSDEFTPTDKGSYFWVEILYDSSGTIVHQGACGERLETSVISLNFQPIVTSEVAQKYLKSGDALVDTLVFSVQADVNGVVNPWAQQVNGDYAKITAAGTVYGPFSEPQVQAATAPVGAPVAGTATVTTNKADGPTITYTATASSPASTAGYYVWVWEIRFDDQSAATQFYLPQPDPANGIDGYFWADDFGIAAETAIVVPTVSTLATPTGIAGYPITDTATVTGDVFVGAEVGFEAFLQVDDVPTCNAATLAFTSTRQPVAGAGEYVSDEFTPTDKGTYFWVETLFDSSGTIVHQGECGALLETSVISLNFQPIVTSEVAQKYLKSGDDLVDTLVFSVQGDVNGVVNPWAQEANSDYAKITAAGTVYGPFSEPQVQAATAPVGALVAGTATVTTNKAEGPTVTYTATASNPASTAGYYVWVWEIRFDDQSAATQFYLPQPDPANGIDGYFWADDFGIAAETAIVVPKVSTLATPTGIAGYPITDTATVTGDVFVGAEVGFEAFLQVDDVPTCTAATLAFTSTRQLVSDQGDYTSEEFIPTLGGTYLWVESVYDDAGTVAHRGVCGELLEITIVDQFHLSTVATKSAAPGEMTTDKAKIRGVLPTDSELMFSAYYSETDTPVCSPTNRVYTTVTPIAVPAGFYDGSEFTSAGFNTTGLADGYLFWVATITDDAGTVIGEGECGAVGEMTQLRTLARTGLYTSSLGLPITVGVLLLLLGGLLAAVTVTRRRKTTAL